MPKTDKELTIEVVNNYTSVLFTHSVGIDNEDLRKLIKDVYETISSLGN